MSLPPQRWLQLAIGVAGMVLIANLQYSWTLFVGPMSAAHGWNRAAIQTAFAIFIVSETWLLPFLGTLADRFGPRIATAAGGAMVALGWSLNGLAESLPVLYVAATVTGVSAGLVYGTAVGNAMKWFPDRRGMAAGITAAGFGAGSALTVVPISHWVVSHGYQSAFLTFGLGQGACLVVASLWLRRPPNLSAPKTSPIADKTPTQVLREPAFYVMYAMFVLVGSGGLIATAQLATIATDFRVQNSPVSLLGVTLPALTFALTLDRIMNGLTRPFFGWVSDYLGRENTMFIAFLLEAGGIAALMVFAHDPVIFVLLTGLVFFAWGEIYSLFPAACSDRFGTRFATANYGMMYTAKGVAALIVPVSALIEMKFGWAVVFWLASGANLVAAALAIFVLKRIGKPSVTEEALTGMPAMAAGLPAP